MRVVICGITGFIGKSVSEFLKDNGYDICGVGRSDIAKGVEHLQQIISGADAVINLAGAPFLKPWSNKWKNEILNSRVNTTRVLVEAINGIPNPPGIFISSSAVGIYDNINFHDEFSEDLSSDFPAIVCKSWEAEALKINPSVRLSVFRFGIVLSSKGGIMKKILFPFKIGMGGIIGDGNQYLPFVHVNDLVRVFKWVLETQSSQGIYNISAPQIISNKEFVKSLAKALHRPAIFRVPMFLLQIIYGDASQILISGQQVVPHRLLAAGFIFNYPTIHHIFEYEFGEV